MANALFTSAFEKPHLFRRALLNLPIGYSEEPLSRGAHFYVHLTKICDVACAHCMYSSESSNSAGRAWRLEDSDVELTLQYVEESAPTKMTISGGGEPFLELKHLLHLVEKSQCGYIELDTAANWARDSKLTRMILENLCNAVRHNPTSPTLIIRASIDEFHLNARNPVPLNAYVNLVRNWIPFRDQIDLGLRGLILKDDRSIDILAETLGGQLLTRDSWNKVLKLPDNVALPVTFNVLRFTGRASQIQHEFADRTHSLQQYFATFENSYGKLNLSRSINDAINAKYYPCDGLSITLDYDGSLYIFTATAPDRRCNIRTHTFENSLKWFYRDPITRVLLAEGPYWLCEKLLPVAPSLVEDTLRGNDICSLVETLLSDVRIRSFVAVLAVNHLLSCGYAQPIAPDELLEQIGGSSIEDLQVQFMNSMERGL